MLLSVPVISGEKARFCVTDSDISHIVSRDRNAMAEFYESTKTSVYGFILSIVRNPADAEDVMQETYVRIFTSASDYEPRGKPMAWVFTIARNQSFLLLRSGKRRADITDEELEAFFAEDNITDIEEKQVLSAALKELGDEERQIVMLHAVSGLRHKEIAEILDKPLSTVLSKYNRAMKKLSKLLEGGAYSE